MEAQRSWEQKNLSCVPVFTSSAFRNLSPPPACKWRTALSNPSWSLISDPVYLSSACCLCPRLCETCCWNIKHKKPTFTKANEVDEARYYCKRNKQFPVHSSAALRGISRCFGNMLDQNNQYSEDWLYYSLFHCLCIGFIFLHVNVAKKGKKAWFRLCSISHVFYIFFLPS